ncbi:UNKNOWN [Stylonychia lemnae]|uniref:Uncharacterized protein n=1 Tax=Stylonychia lemnae TaxID=5949 RepID=A0A078AGR5_STYLE|nr:UNKNOWN [Stylonychia lemnae]|eukprot:CDW81389.1 UNKNOWN [Stylonychia lemnae]
MCRKSLKSAWEMEDFQSIQFKNSSSIRLSIENGYYMSSALGDEIYSYCNSCYDSVMSASEYVVKERLQNEKLLEEVMQYNKQLESQNQLLIQSVEKDQQQE